MLTRISVTLNHSKYLRYHSSSVAHQNSIERASLEAAGDISHCQVRSVEAHRIEKVVNRGHERGWLVGREGKHEADIHKGTEEEVLKDGVEVYSALGIEASLVGEEEIDKVDSPKEKGDVFDRQIDAKSFLSLQADQVEK